VELQLYRWELTDGDAVRVEETIDEIVASGITAALFTTQVQVRHVFDVATRQRRLTELTDALRDRVIVGAVGPTCATALRERGVEPHVVPEHPKMGHLVLALAREVERRSAARMEGVA
jgi:uroporphyrinogen-III synthase